MKTTTRDNLIYLTVGVGIAAVVAARVFYAERHGLVVGHLPTFPFRLVTSTFTVGYFVARQARRLGASATDVVTSVLDAGLIQAAVGFAFHRAIGSLSSISHVILVVLETVLIVNLMIWGVSYFRSRSRRG